MTTLPIVTSGATPFWSELEPNDERLLRLARRLEDAESRGVGVLEDDVGAAADLRERLLLPALTSSQLPMYELSTTIPGFDRLRARVNAAKLSFTGGSSVPPMTPMTFDFVIAPASMPARYDASAKPKSMPATFAPVDGRRGDDVDGLGEIRADALRGVLELEAVAEDEVVPLRAVLPEVLLELGGRLRLDVADAWRRGCRGCEAGPGRRRRSRTGR